MSSQMLSTLSSQFGSLISDHFIPSLPPLPILAPTKYVFAPYHSQPILHCLRQPRLLTAYRYFVPHLHLTVLSTTSASIPTALLIASRAAFFDLRIPKIKRIGYELVSSGQAEEGDKDLSGIKAAVRGSKGRGKAKGVMRGSEDWDLDLEDGDGTAHLEGRDSLPVLVTLNLVC